LLCAFFLPFIVSSRYCLLGKMPVRCTGKQKTQSLGRSFVIALFICSTIDEGGHVFSIHDKHE
jgi:hypothetical protein